MAEGEGFEPPVPSQAQRFSSALDSVMAGFMEGYLVLLYLAFGAQDAHAVSSRTSQSNPVRLQHVCKSETPPGATPHFLPFRRVPSAILFSMTSTWANLN